jgi:hypothetical protein
MSFEDYKLVIYRNQPQGRVGEIPAIRLPCVDGDAASNACGSLRS